MLSLALAMLSVLAGPALHTKVETATGLKSTVGTHMPVMLSTHTRMAACANCYLGRRRGSKAVALPRTDTLRSTSASGTWRPLPGLGPLLLALVTLSIAKRTRLPVDTRDNGGMLVSGPSEALPAVVGLASSSSPDTCDVVDCIATDRPLFVERVRCLRMETSGGEAWPSLGLGLSVLASLSLAGVGCG